MIETIHFQTNSQDLSNTPFSIAHVQRLYNYTSWYTTKNSQTMYQI